MSRAFVKESDREERAGVPPAPLPPGVPNYVTPAGAAALRAERTRLGEERAGLRGLDTPEARARLGVVEQRLALLDARAPTWVELAAPASVDRVCFGCGVDLEGVDGRHRRVWIVGVDEVDAGNGRVSFLAPLARALMGAAVGDLVTVETPRGAEEVDVVGLTGGDPAPAPARATPEGG